uniref:Uncharacterized protein n=1 Tax=Rhizophora mucronata TaxID=61149 RepID=A0A2P2PBK6_RHIMU
MHPFISKQFAVNATYNFEA